VPAHGGGSEFELLREIRGRGAAVLQDHPGDALPRPGGDVLDREFALRRHGGVVPDGFHNTDVT
jgi:hypothetical protein